MKAELLVTEMEELQRFFRRSFNEGAIDLLWLDFMAEPDEALEPAMRRLKTERNNLPTVAIVLSSIQEESRKIEEARRREEEYEERRKRNQYEMLGRRKREAMKDATLPPFVGQVYRLCGRIASGEIDIDQQLDELYRLREQWPTRQKECQEMIDERERERERLQISRRLAA